LLLPSLLENATDGWGDPASRTRAADRGGTRTLRLGADLTIVALGNMVSSAIEASEVLGQRGISAEVLDPFCLSPLDIDSIKSSVLRTRRAIVVDEAPRDCSIASEIAASLMEDPEVFRALLHPVARVNGAPVPIPYSPSLEDAVLPSVEDVISMAQRCMDQE
jgi:pyruvate dehydrogenase E1 component beta subunit